MRNLSGNERYEGFCVDLIREIAQRVGFNYTIRLAPEAKYGISDPNTGEWNGIVRELMDRVCTLRLYGAIHQFVVLNCNVRALTY